MERLRQQIISELLTATTVDDCVNYQMKDATEYYRDEMRQNIWLWLLTYDIRKLSAKERVELHFKAHLNALVTRFISTQYWSKNSPFHKVYRKMQSLEDEIGYEALEIPE